MHYIWRYEKAKDELEMEEYYSGCTKKRSII